MSYGTLCAISLGHLARGEDEAAAEIAHRTFQVNPYWSMTHLVLAATHARLGRLDAAKAAAKRLLELQPGFTISGTNAAFDIHPSPLGARSW
jgi:predicted TPR repeat methyltransferase